MGLYTIGKVAAIAEIKAAVNARISTLSDGSKSVDIASLTQWLAEQGDIVVSEVPTDNRTAARGVLATISVDRENQELAGYISRTYWEKQPGWPTATSIVSNLGFVSSVATAVRDMEASVTAIESYYTEQNNALPTTLTDVYAELKIGEKLPTAENRVLETRYYIYTYVTDRGEESAPSPVSEAVIVDQNDFVDVDFIAPPSPYAAYTPNYRVYRSNSSAQDSAFQFVAETTLLTYTDEIDGSDLQEVVPSITWDMPPAKLQGLTGIPNGIMAGFFDNTIAFSEQNIPHAWPTEYQLTTEHPIVAMAVFGQTLVVGTRGNPYYVSGADPSSMSAVKMESRQSCVSARSMIPVDGGVVYSSPDGLCFATGQGIQVATQGIFTREDWQALNPAGVVCAYHDGIVYFYSTGGTVYALNVGAGKLVTATLDSPPTTLYVDNITDKIYAASGTNVTALFTATQRRTATWRSKIFVLPRPVPFVWLQIESDFSAPITVEWYGDGVLRYTATVSSRTPVRLPVGEFLEHELAVSSTARWNSLTIASSTGELQGVPS
jgi:hypothetical protein